MSTGRPPESSPHLHLLEVAHSLGHVDGGLAARVEAAGSVGPQPTCCRGREPEEFARHLWADRPGAPPSGLVLNAPLWYAAGFAEALTGERAGHLQPPRWPRPRTSPGATPRSAAALLPRRRSLDRPLPRPAPPVEDLAARPVPLDEPGVEQHPRVPADAADREVEPGAQGGGAARAPEGGQDPGP